MLLSMLSCAWTAVGVRILQDDLPDKTGNTTTVRRFSIDFRINSRDIDSTYSRNSHTLSQLNELIDEARKNPHMSLDSLLVSGYASPDGPLPKNRELSLRRAVSLRNYLKEKCGVPDSLMNFGENDVPWKLFRELVSSSNYQWRDEAMRIISAGSDSSAADNTRRMNRLKRLAGGEAWKILKRDILPKLRSAYVITTVITLRETEGIEESEASTDNVKEIEMPVETPAPTEPASTLREQDYDRFAIKTNAVYLAAGVTNLGVEMAVSPHWSIDLPLVYSPYTIARNYRMRFLYIQPEARYWLNLPLRGHFFGIHAHIGVANVSFNRENRYQTPNGFYGGGISYGYSLPVAKRWSIEFTIGAGYVFTKYDSYYNVGVPTGQLHSKGTSLNYWGIDKAGINITYRFGDKSGPRKALRGKEAVAK